MSPQRQEILEFLRERTDRAEDILLALDLALKTRADTYRFGTLMQHLAFTKELSVERT